MNLSPKKIWKSKIVKSEVFIWDRRSWHLVIKNFHVTTKDGNFLNINKSVGLMWCLTTTSSAHWAWVSVSKRHYKTRCGGGSMCAQAKALWESLEVLLPIENICSCCLERLRQLRTISWRNFVSGKGCGRGSMCAHTKDYLIWNSGTALAPVVNLKYSK